MSCLTVNKMESGEQEDCSAVDVNQRIREFQSRINKISSRDNNNNSDQENRNLSKTRSKSLPAKSQLVKHNSSDSETSEREVRDLEETPAPAVCNNSDTEDERVILPSVKMLANKFNASQSRARRFTSQVCILFLVKL